MRILSRNLTCPPTPSFSLRSKGVKAVYQLQGGIHEYCRELVAGGEGAIVGDAPGAGSLEAAAAATGTDLPQSLFRGRNFVFDRRLATPPVGGGEFLSFFYLFPLGI